MVDVNLNLLFFVFKAIKKIMCLIKKIESFAQKRLLEGRGYILNLILWACISFGVSIVMPACSVFLRDGKMDTFTNFFEDVSPYYFSFSWITRDVIHGGVDFVLLALLFTLFSVLFKLGSISISVLFRTALFVVLTFPALLKSFWGSLFIFTIYNESILVTVLASLFAVGFLSLIGTVGVVFFSVMTHSSKKQALIPFVLSLVAWYFLNGTFKVYLSMLIS